MTFVVVNKLQYNDREQTRGAHDVVTKLNQRQ